MYLSAEAPNLGTSFDFDFLEPHPHHQIYAMSYLSNFIRFPDLPPELRLMIWEYALSGWTVLAPGYHCTAFQDAEATHAQTTMIPVGPA